MLVSPMKIARIVLAAAIGYSYPGYAQQGGSTVLEVLESSPTVEESRSAHFLLPACEAVKNSIMSPAGFQVAAFCLGLTDATRNWGQIIPSPLKSCVPHGATNDQVVMVVVKYFHDHPSLLHKSYLMMIAAALADAYPCK
jgi:hypothetical protein